MIEVHRASRWYGQVIGLNDVSCSIGVGCTALLGQNGAGKSTLIKLITGQLKPTTGEVRVLGEGPFANPRMHRQMGYCPETDSFYEDMTGREFVALMARMSGIARAGIPDAVARAIELVGMQERADTMIAGYSKGMRQRIKLAQALVHTPTLLILDEPLSGLDPVGRREMSELLKAIAAQGNCVLISSHILHEVERMTQNILLLHGGRLLAMGDVRQIRALIDRHPHRVHIAMEGARDFAQRLLRLPSVLSLTFNQANPNQFELETTAPDEFYTQIADIVLDGKSEFYNFYSPDNNLEAVFNYLVRK